VVRRYFIIPIIVIYLIFPVYFDIIINPKSIYSSTSHEMQRPFTPESQ